jgi:predicted lipid-binding transport protein (Tim44 family)
MKNLTGLVVTLLFALTLTFGAITDAEARRFGGGGNFGGRSTYSAPYQRSVQPTRPANQQQQAGNSSQAAKPGWANRGGLMGMLGGLAIGGLLGSMFMGGGFHGFNFLDILVFGALAYFLFKMLAARNASAQRPSYSQGQGNNAPDSSYNYQPYEQPTPNNPAGFNTDILFNKDKKAGFSDQPQQPDADFNTAVIPQNFDTQAFLNGAKIAYRNLQKAWDERDLAEIRSLTTDKVFAEIQDQLKASDEENRTVVLKVDAELLEVREIGGEIEAVVLFDCVLREEHDAQAGQVREVWHFVKPANPNQTKWLLDGIQQLAE